jgi:hypothetical protein
MAMEDQKGKSIGKWEGYKNYDHYFWVNPQDQVGGSGNIDDFLEEIQSTTITVITNRTKYLNIPCSFDIETSSFLEYGLKKATMYLWSFCFNGSTILGRTWDEFIELIDMLSYQLSTNKYKLIIYVHNLSYEFQFMRKWFTWEKVFAVETRRPAYAIMSNGIEFRCSYLLSNYKLAYIGENLLSTYSVQKDVGALDYSKVRHYLTPLTEEEVWYSVHDVQVVTSYIQEKIENEGNITHIPLTNTGYVRRYCRDFCFTQQQIEPAVIKKLSARYHERMKSLIITSKGEYDSLQQAFAGGFTHAAPSWSGQVVENVDSYDLASSYPAVMVMKKFPIARGVFIGNCEIETIEKLIEKGYCVLFTVKLWWVDPRFIYESYISKSRCLETSDDAVINNGRVASAMYITCTITEQDWDIIKKCYFFDRVEVYSARFYPAGYLPRPFILSILHLFANKTSLKGVEGKETEYMVSKNMINSSYGMSVTNIIRDIYEYSNVDSWTTEKADVTSQLVSYNNNHNRFLFYAWGVWVTAHARHNLWDAIFECGPDFVYADTDSVKLLNGYKHEHFFTLYNLHIEVQIRKVADYWNIPISLYQPLTKKGEKKTIGIWEKEETYKRFKTIGAKRYLYEYQSGELLFTVSGVNKHIGTPYMLHTYSNRNSDEDYDLFKLAYSDTPSERDRAAEALSRVIEMHNRGDLDYNGVFEAFTDGLYFPPYSTGKQTLTYIDNGGLTSVRDYLGNSTYILELSYIHMEPQEYNMSQSEEYIKFLRGYRDASL